MRHICCGMSKCWHGLCCAFAAQSAGLTHVTRAVKGKALLITAAMDHAEEELGSLLLPNRALRWLGLSNRTHRD
eukprot:1213850-Rhodomonas_salina.2